MKTRLQPILLLALAMFSMLALSQEVVEKAKVLKIDEIKSLLVGKSMSYQSTNGGKCTIQFSANGYGFSRCDAGIGSGKYTIGYLTTAGELRDTEDKQARPRFCIKYQELPLNLCSIIYLRADGTYWMNANKTEIKIH